MSGISSPTELAAPTSFEHWSDPKLKDIQPLIVAKLAPADAARAATASKDLDQLVQSSWPWPKILLGRARRGPLPTQSSHIIDGLLAPYKRAGHLECILQHVQKYGDSLNEDSVFKADLESWLNREELVESSHAEAYRIRQAYTSQLPLTSLCLEDLPIRTLPHCIGKLVRLQFLELQDCQNLAKLPEVLGNLTNLKELNLSYTNLTELPESLSSLSNLENLNLACCKKLTSLPESFGKLASIRYLDISFCTHLRGKPLPAGVQRPELLINWP